MKIQIEFHGVLRRLAGMDCQQIELPEAATAADALALLRGPEELALRLRQCACAIGDELVPRTARLSDGMKLALIPPVSGG